MAANSAGQPPQNSRPPTPFEGAPSGSGLRPAKSGSAWLSRRSAMVPGTEAFVRKSAAVSRPPSYSVPLSNTAEQLQRMREIISIGRARRWDLLKPLTHALGNYDERSNRYFADLYRIMTPLERLTDVTQIYLSGTPSRSPVTTRQSHGWDVAEGAVNYAAATGHDMALLLVAGAAHDGGHLPGGHAAEDGGDDFWHENSDSDIAWFRHAPWGGYLAKNVWKLSPDVARAVEIHSTSEPVGERDEFDVITLFDQIANAARDLADICKVGILTWKELENRFPQALGITGISHRDFWALEPAADREAHLSHMILSALTADAVEEFRRTRRVAVSKFGDSVIGEIRSRVAEYTFLRGEHAQWQMGLRVGTHRLLNEYAKAYRDSMSQQDSVKAATLRLSQLTDTQMFVEMQRFGIDTTAMRKGPDLAPPTSLSPVRIPAMDKKTIGLSRLFAHSPYRAEGPNGYSADLTFAEALAVLTKVRDPTRTQTETFGLAVSDDRPGPLPELFIPTADHSECQALDAGITAGIGREFDRAIRRYESLRNRTDLDHEDHRFVTSFEVLLSLGPKDMSSPRPAQPRRAGTYDETAVQMVAAYSNHRTVDRTLLLGRHWRLQAGEALDDPLPAAPVVARQAPPSGRDKAQIGITLSM